MDDVGKIIEDATTSAGDQEDQGNLDPEKPEIDNDQDQASGSEGDDGAKDPLEAVLEDLGEDQADEVDGEDDVSGDEDTAKEDDTSKPKKGSKKTVSARIKHYKDQRDEEALRAARLEGELNALKSMNTQTTKGSHEERVDIPVPPDPENFATETEYYDAKLKYEVKLAEDRILAKFNQGRDTDSKAKSAAAVREERNATIKTKGDKLVEKHTDFWEVVTEIGNYFYTNVALDFIAESDKGAEIAYVLAKSPAFGKKVFGKSVNGQIKELSRLEDKLSGASNGIKGTKTTPITPIAGHRKSVRTGMLSDNPTDEEVGNLVDKLQGRKLKSA